MLTAPTLERLQALTLRARAPAWTAQQQPAARTALAFAERFGRLVDAEWLARENKRRARALAEAKLTLPPAGIEAIDYPARRARDKAVGRQLAPGRWVQAPQTVLGVGATGVGKRFVARALAPQACRPGDRARYWRVARLFHAGSLARADGRYGRRLAQCARVDVSVRDDGGLAPLPDAERRDRLARLADRYGPRSTIVTSQVPPAQGHDALGDPTLADAICDRLLHTAHRRGLKGPARRKAAHPDA